MNPPSKCYRVVGLTAIVCVTCFAAVGQITATEITFPTVQPGATAFDWVQLPAGTSAVSGTVTGPFAIALQASYDYGSIDGVSFGLSAVTNGVCSPDAPACAVYLGVEFLGAATPGSSTGTVTLDDGLIYSLSASVLGPGLIFTPSSIDGGSVPVGSISDTYTITITNVASAGSAGITLDPPTVSGPFSITNNCGASLAASATCTINISFAPTATGAASGELQVPTAVGNLEVSLTGTGLDNPANVQISPATITFALTPPTFAETRTVTLTNLSSVDSVQAGALTLSTASFCPTSSDVLCMVVVANTCATLASLATCQIQLRYQGEAGEVPEPGSAQIPLTPSSSSSAFTYSVPFTQVLPSSATAGVLSVSPAVLQFLTNPFGQASVPQSVTVTNRSQSIVSISANPVTDFVIDPSCGPLLPGKSCNLSVHYVPVSGAGQSSSQLTINAFDTATVTTFPPFPPPIGAAAVSVTGFATPSASIASPSYPPLIQPMNIDLTGGGVEVSNTSTTPLVLGAIAGVGNVMATDATACSLPIPPGGSCTVYVSGDCPGSINCQFAISSNAFSSPDIYLVPAQPSDTSPWVSFTTSFSWGVSPGAAGFNAVVFPPTAPGASATGTLLLSLFNPFTQIDDAISVVPNVSSEFTVDNQCPALLVPHIHIMGYIGSCNVVLTFAPKTLGFHSGTVTFNTSLGLWTVLMAGTAPGPPALQVTPASLALGALAGQTAAGTVTLKNTSSTPLSLSPAALAGPQAADFKITQATCSSSLAAGATCTIQVTYANPEYLSAAQLILTSGNNDIQTVTLTGVIPELLVSSNGGSFQPTSIGNQTHGGFTLTTFQGAPITIQSLTITGANASHFKIVGNTCTAGFVLQGTTSCSVDIAFTPLEIGPLTANWTIASSIGTRSGALYGTGALGPAQVSHTALMFGNQALLIPSTAQLVTLTNPNPQALTLPPLPVLSGANPSDFTMSGSCTAIPANSACSLNVVFNPSATGTRTAAITVGTGTMVNPDNGLPVNASTTVNFTGVGVATGPGAAVHPLNVHFRRREVGSVSREERIFLRNPGTTTLTLPAPPAITGADPLDFRLTGICSSIAVGGHCELEVQFAPTAEGRRSATLSIPTGGRANGSAQVSLTGTGCLADDEERHERDEEGCERKHDEGRPGNDHDH
jgi:hypothetical protein